MQDVVGCVRLAFSLLAVAFVIVFLYGVLVADQGSQRHSKYARIALAGITLAEFGLVWWMVCTTTI